MLNTILFFVFLFILIQNLTFRREGQTDLKSKELLEKLKYELDITIEEKQRLKETPVLLTLNSQPMDQLKDYAPTLGTEPEPAASAAPAAQDFAGESSFGLKETPKQSDDLRNFQTILSADTKNLAEKTIAAEPPAAAASCALDVPPLPSRTRKYHDACDCSKIDHTNCRNLKISSK